MIVLSSKTLISTCARYYGDLRATIRANPSNWPAGVKVCYSSRSEKAGDGDTNCSSSDDECEKLDNSSASNEDAKVPVRRLVCGLGNMGTTFENTRHNAGFEVVRHFARVHGTHFNVNYISTEQAKNILFNFLQRDMSFWCYCCCGACRPQSFLFQNHCVEK